MRVLALVESVNHVCCRYRLTAFRSLLEKAGHQLGLQSLPRSWWSWLHIGQVVRFADAVILQRRLLAGWQLHLLRKASQRLPLRRGRCRFFFETLRKPWIAQRPSATPLRRCTQPPMP